jgi:hypothetical protein
MSKARVGQLGAKVEILEAIELQREEDQLARDQIHPLRHILIEAADFRIFIVAGIDETGIAHDLG